MSQSLHYYTFIDEGICEGMYDGIAADIDCDGIDISVVTNLDVSEIEIASLDEVEVNRPCGTVACYRDVLDIGIPGQAYQQSVYGACRIIDASPTS